jgi:putative addiction module killer protein
MIHTLSGFPDWRLVLLAYVYPLGYIHAVIEIRKTSIFDRWLRRLRDRKAVARIQSRIDRLQIGLLGDVKPAGEGVSEMRIDYGPGYRIYFVQLGRELVILMTGGDKSTQRQDIAKAMELARKL